MRALPIAIALAACSSPSSPATVAAAEPELCTAPPSSCTVAPDQLVRLMAMPAHAFDQNAAGWRSVGETRCFLESAAVIDAYLLSHDVDDADRPNLYFHAGQGYALGGATTLATSRFAHALRADEPSDTSFHWNAYVRATVAFLARDRDALRAQAGQLSDGDGPNRTIVERFDRCFGGSYRAVYLGGC